MLDMFFDQKYPFEQIMQKKLAHGQLIITYPSTAARGAGRAAADSAAPVGL